MCSTTSRPTPAAYEVSEPICTKPARVSTFADPMLCSATHEAEWLTDRRRCRGRARSALRRVLVAPLLDGHHHDRTWFRVPYGSLTDEPTLEPTAHMFVGSKASWYEILDDLPQHDEYPWS